MAAGYASCPAISDIFPDDTPEHKSCFELLRRAYIEARYNPYYRITKQELEYLAKCVKKLQRLTKKICTQKIESFV